MNVIVSCFHRVRYFEKYIVPFSTAIWDPLWYHDNQGSRHIFFDKSGVVNGLRAPMLCPPKWLENGCNGRENCTKLNDLEHCAFLVAYEDYLNTLNFTELIEWLKRACVKIEVRSDFGGHEPVCALLVHEAPSNPCSERRGLMKYFYSNGVYVPEWDEAYGNKTIQT